MFSSRRYIIIMYMLLSIRNNKTRCSISFQFPFDTCSFIKFFFFFFCFTFSVFQFFLFFDSFIQAKIQNLKLEWENSRCKSKKIWIKFLPNYINNCLQSILTWMVIVDGTYHESNLHLLKWREEKKITGTIYKLYSENI